MRLGPSRLIEELIGLLEEAVKDAWVEDVRIGLFYTGVKLSTGHGGVAYTPHKWIVEATCCPEMQRKMPYTGKLKGMRAVEAMRLAQTDHLLLRAVGVAAINAASAPILFEEGRYRLEYDADPVSAERLRPGDRVVMIGAFKPYVESLRMRAKELMVYDDNVGLLRELGLPENPGKPLEEALEEADLVIVTGSALVVSGMDEILENASRAREVVVVGPTSSMLPDPFFRRGVTALAGLRILDADKMLQAVSEAGGTRSIVKYSARKFVAWRGGAGSAERR